MSTAWMSSPQCCLFCLVIHLCCATLVANKTQVMSLVELGTSGKTSWIQAPTPRCWQSVFSLWLNQYLNQGAFSVHLILAFVVLFSGSEAKLHGMEPWFASLIRISSRVTDVWFPLHIAAVEYVCPPSLYVLTETMWEKTPNTNILTLTPCLLFYNLWTCIRIRTVSITLIFRLLAFKILFTVRTSCGIDRAVSHFTQSNGSLIHSHDVLLAAAKRDIITLPF